MDKLKKLQDLVNLEKEPSLVLYEKLEQLTDTIQVIGEEVKESREILLDKKKLKELLTPVYGVDYLTEADIDRISAEILAKATPVKGIDYKDGDKGDKGEDGKNGLNGINGLDGLDGENGKDGKDGVNGKDGKDGKDGETPDHEWLGTKLRFKKANGDWGRWVDLKGKDGKGVSIFGGGGVSLPNTSGNAGKVLAVKTDESGVEWVNDLDQINSLQFDLTPTGTCAEGQMMWNSDAGTVELGLPGGNVCLQMGQELLIKAKNVSGSGTTNGKAFYISGASGSNPEADFANAADDTGSKVIAVCTENINNNSSGYFTTFGLVRDMNTAFGSDGDTVYLDDTDGGLTTDQLDYPDLRIKIGYILRSHATEGVLLVTIQGDQWLKRFQAMQEPTGFPLGHTDLIGDISFTDIDRTFTIAPKTGQSFFAFWESGKEYRKTTAQTKVITDVEGIHVLYFDGGVLTESVNPTRATMSALVKGKALVSIIYWDASASTAIYVGEERHGTAMDNTTHTYLHYTQGLQYLFGLGLNTMSVGGTGVTADAQFGVDAGGVDDEDIYFPISAVNSTTGLPIYYMTGAATWNKYTNAGFSVRTFDGTDATRLAYNQYTGGAWQLTQVGSGNYVLCHVFATTEKDKPMIAVMGQNEYTTLPAARTGADTEIRELILNDLLFPEIRPIATVIFQTNLGYANAVNARVVATADGDNYVDWRSETIDRVSLTTSDHNSLTGLQGGTSGEYYHTTSAQNTDLAAITAGKAANKIVKANSTGAGIEYSTNTTLDTTGNMITAGNVDAAGAGLGISSVAGTILNLYGVKNLIRSKGNGTFTNYCSGGTAYASSITAGYPASYAFDGNPTGTAWESANDNTTVWLAYNFPVTRIVNHIRLYARYQYEGVRFNNFTISGSSNSTNGSDGTWTTLASGLYMHGIPGYYSEFHFENENSYTWIKITGAAMLWPPGGYYVWLGEAQFGYEQMTANIIDNESGVSKVYERYSNYEGVLSYDNTATNGGYQWALNSKVALSIDPTGNVRVPDDRYLCAKNILWEDRGYQATNSVNGLGIYVYNSNSSTTPYRIINIAGYSGQVDTMSVLSGRVGVRMSNALQTYGNLQVGGDMGWHGTPTTIRNASNSDTYSNKIQTQAMVIATPNSSAYSYTGTDLFSCGTVSDGTGVFKVFSHPTYGGYNKYYQNVLQMWQEMGQTAFITLAANTYANQFSLGCTAATTGYGTQFAIYVPANCPGTAHVTAGSATVTAGYIFDFTRAFRVGETITVNGETKTISSIASASSMTMNSNFAASGTHIAIVRTARFTMVTNQNGRVGIGQNSPTSWLHLGAGVAAVGGAQLKLDASTLLTTPEAGAIEAVTDDLYYTIGTGAARKKIVLDDGTALTATRVPFATTNGRLTDNSTFTCDNNGNVKTNSTTTGTEFYLGDATVDGSWRIAKSGNNLVFERRESSAWVTKSTISA